MIIDVLVSVEYHNKGNFRAFNLSIGTLSIAVFFHLITAIIKNAQGTIWKKLRGAIIALLLLSPAVESYDYWRGAKVEDSPYDQVLILILTRAIEMVLESVPESAIQLAILFKIEKPTYLMIFSIASSIAAAAFIMTDTNISFERGQMISRICDWAIYITP